MHLNLEKINNLNYLLFKFIDNILTIQMCFQIQTSES